MPAADLNMPAACLAIGTIAMFRGERCVVSGFASGGRVIVCIRSALYTADAADVWGLPCVYNANLANRRAA